MRGLPCVNGIVHPSGCLLHALHKKLNQGKGFMAEASGFTRVLHSVAACMLEFLGFGVQGHSAHFWLEAWAPNQRSYAWGVLFNFPDAKPFSLQVNAPLFS